MKLWKKIYKNKNVENYWHISYHFFIYWETSLNIIEDFLAALHLSYHQKKIYKNNFFLLFITIETTRYFISKEIFSISTAVIDLYLKINRDKRP